jgi:flagellar biosynthesis chaperone FliJ
MAISRKVTPKRNPGTGPTVRFARLVETGLRDDLSRLHDDLLAEESRLTALEEIRWHSMKDFEAFGEGGVTTSEAALYYTLFHHLTQEIDLQGRLVVNARRRVRDKQVAVSAAADERQMVERLHRQVRRVPVSAGASDEGDRPILKKAS